MKYVRFYLDHDSPADKRRGRHNGNVIALLDPERNWWRDQYSGRLYEALGATFAWPNSPVATTGVAASYLRTQAKRISEAKAREIHPALFERLDGEGVAK